ncbi:MAG: nucleoside triphosphate pyrophosphohydrolase [Bryobacterales bacterium]|nr:nucleoside triphosphate pyrophosphohydrolase [Bryobacterales bacterium]
MSESSEAPGAGAKFNRLVEIMARLRAPDGCPWDREQDFSTLKKYLLEETYEVLHSIDTEDWPNLAEELGDLMLQPVFLAQIAAERGMFSIADSLDAINTKLVRRHPHVFGEENAETAEDVKHRWDQIKAEEKREKGREEKTLLEGVSRVLPALVEAQEIGSKVAKVGFDWPSADDVVDKIHEELNEIAEARQGSSREHVEEEIGDLLFAVVNLARLLKIDSEQALRRANLKFRDRFTYVEQRLKEEGRPLGEATLEEMEAKWQEAKSR